MDLYWFTGLFCSAVQKKTAYKRRLHTRYFFFPIRGFIQKRDKDLLKKCKQTLQVEVGSKNNAFKQNTLGHTGNSHPQPQYKVVSDGTITIHEHELKCERWLQQLSISWQPRNQISKTLLEKKKILKTIMLSYKSLVHLDPENCIQFSCPHSNRVD